MVLNDYTNEARQMVIAVRQETQSDYLKPKLITEKQISRLVILDEFKFIESEFEDKKTHEKTKKSMYTGKVSVQVPNSEAIDKVWAMNKTSSNTVIDVLGEDTAKWIGCIIRVIVSPIAGNDSIVVDEIGTRELNPGKALPAKSK